MGPYRTMTPVEKPPEGRPKSGCVDYPPGECPCRCGHPCERHQWFNSESWCNAGGCQCGGFLLAEDD